MTDGAAGAEATEQPARTWFDRVYAAIPLATVFVALLALYAWEAARHTSPWLFTDELELSQISRAIEATGHGARRGDPYFWQTLYTWLIAPAWAITSTTLAYAVVKYIGVVTMTLALFPTYFLARTVVVAARVAVRGGRHRRRARARLRADDPRGAAQLPVRGARLPR